MAAGSSLARRRFSMASTSHTIQNERHGTTACRASWRMAPARGQAAGTTHVDGGQAIYFFLPLGRLEGRWLRSGKPFRFVLHFTAHPSAQQASGGHCQTKAVAAFNLGAYMSTSRTRRTVLAGLCQVITNVPHLISTPYTC